MNYRRVQSNWFSVTMHTSLVLLVFIFLAGSRGAECTNASESCKTLYKKGVEAYLENRYQDCIWHFEDAVELYRGYTKKLQHCRLKCHQEAELSDPLYHVDVENLRFFETTVKNTLCIVKCRNQDKHLFEEYNLDHGTVKKFEGRKPYEYLHICYLQEKDLQKAASSSFTYLVANPNDEAMLKHLKHYTTSPAVIMADVINYEAKDYVYLYVHGAKAYEEKNWDEVVQNMEESLASYLQTEEECRAQCEGPYDQGWFPDFIPSIANHFTHCLRCKRKCKEQLSTLNGEKHDDLFQSHYHYLQYAYFKVGNLKAACQAVTSYLLFYPFDETMLYNMEYYKKMPKVQDDYFLPRPEALSYYHRNVYEENLMSYIFTVFTKETIIDKGKIYNALYVDRDVKLRFVLDDFVTPGQCEALLEVVRNYSVPGDGYQGTTTPHTIHEDYGGLSLGRAGKLVNAKQMDKRSLRLVLEVADGIKRTIIQRFGVEKKLHFTFTHLVFRTAKSGAQNNRSDLSHAVHADNCNVQLDGSCPRKSPAFIWRDYTAILYLNDEFVGGELFFAKDYDGADVEEVVAPKCGRLVGFTSGGENLHGVRAVRNGSRYALAVWFTYDKKNFEPERKVLSKYYAN